MDGGMQMEDAMSRKERKRPKNRLKRRLGRVPVPKIKQQEPMRRPAYLYGGVVTVLILLFLGMLFFSTTLLSRGESYTTTDRYRTLGIDVPNGDVTFVRSTDGNVQVKLVDSASSGKRLKVMSSGDGLTVTGRDGMTARFGSRASTEPGRYSVQIGLPSYMTKVNVTSEGVKGQGLYAKKVGIEASRIDMGKLDGDTLDIRGDVVTIDRLDAVRATVFGTKVELTDFTAKISLDVETIDGPIVLEPTKSAGSVTVKTGGEVNTNSRYTKDTTEQEQLVYELSKQEKPEIKVTSEVGEVTLK